MWGYHCKSCGESSPKEALDGDKGALLEAWIHLEKILEIEELEYFRVAAVTSTPAPQYEALLGWLKEHRKHIHWIELESSAEVRESLQIGAQS